jgi:hypothetical protein
MFLLFWYLFLFSAKQLWLEGVYGPLHHSHGLTTGLRTDQWWPILPPGYANTAPPKHFTVQFECQPNVPKGLKRTIQRLYLDGAGVNINKVNLKLTTEATVIISGTVAIKPWKSVIKLVAQKISGMPCHFKNKKTSFTYNVCDVSNHTYRNQRGCAINLKTHFPVKFRMFILLFGIWEFKKWRFWLELKRRRLKASF